jgi:hypothetical protein
MGTTTDEGDMALIEAERGHRDSLPGRDVVSLQGSARLLLADGREAAVDAQLSVRRTFFSISGAGTFTCSKELAFHAVGSSCWSSLVFDDGYAFEISIYQLRSSTSQTRCWFEIQG